jgi:hypothetical protein
VRTSDEEGPLGAVKRRSIHPRRDDSWDVVETIGKEELRLLV